MCQTHALWYEMTPLFQDLLVQSFSPNVFFLCHCYWLNLKHMDIQKNQKMSCSVYHPATSTTSNEGLFRSLSLWLTDVTSSKGDNQLLGLGALWTWFGDHVLVQGLYCALKAGKLHHCVGDLSGPQWNQAFVESAHTHTQESNQSQVTNMKMKKNRLKKKDLSSTSHKHTRKPDHTRTNLHALYCLERP